MGRGSGPALGAARCCRVAEPQTRGWGPSGAQEGPPRRWSGARSGPPGGTQPRSLEGCVLTPAGQRRAPVISVRYDC